MNFALGGLLQLVMMFGPAVLILFSGRASGWRKVKWVLFSILPWVLGQVALVAWIYFAPREMQTQLMMFGSSGIYIATWVAAWSIYFIFLRRLKKPASTLSDVEALTPSDEPRV